MADGLMPPLVLELRAHASQLYSELGKVKSAVTETVDETGKKTKQAASGFDKMAGAGKAMATGIVGAGVLVGGAALKMGMDFQEQTTALVTGAGASKASIDEVSNGILSMAGQVGESTSQLQSGMYMIESAGYDGAQGLSVLRAAAEGAKVGNADLGTVADGLTTTLKDYHLPASQAASVTSALVQTVADGKTHMQDLTGALGSVLPMASQLGVGFGDVGGALATMTNHGFDAARASQDLNHMIGALAADTTPKAAKALATVGLNAQELNDSLKNKGLPATLQMIEDHIGQKFPVGSAKYMDAMRKIMGGQPGLDTALMLSGQNMDEFKKKTVDIGDKMKGAAKHVDGFAEVQGDLKFKLEAAKDGVSAMVTKLGMALIPVVTKVLDVAGKWGSWLADHKPVLIAVAAVVGGVVVTAIAAYIASMVMAAAATIAATWPILLIIAAVVAVGVAIYEFATHWSQIWDGIKSVASAVWEWIKDAAGSFASAVFTPIEAGLHFIESVWHTVWGGISSAFEAVTGFISDHSALIVGVIAIIALPISLVIAAVHLLWTHWQQIWGAITSFMQWAYGSVIKPVGDWIVGNVLQPIGSAISWLGGVWSSIWNAIGSAAQWVYGNVIAPIGSGIGSVFSGIGSALSWLSDAWSSLWSGIGDALTWVYNHTIGPIVNAIGGAIHGVMSAVNGISNVASGIGHMLGFDVGGWIPGAPGAPMPAIVHGQEYMLSREMLAGTQPIDPKVVAAITGQAQAPSASAAGRQMSGGGNTVNVYAQTNADPYRIARETGWALRAMA